MGAANASPDTASTQPPVGGVAGVGARAAPAKASTVVRSRVERPLGAGRCFPGIVRRHIELEKKTKNAPAREVPNNYVAELKRTLLSMPPFYGTGVLYGDINPLESLPDFSLTKVWEPGWRAALQSGTDDDIRVEGTCEDTSGAAKTWAGRGAKGG